MKMKLIKDPYDLFEWMMNCMLYIVAAMATSVGFVLMLIPSLFVGMSFTLAAAGEEAQDIWKRLTTH